MRDLWIHLPTLLCAMALFVASSIPHLDVTVLDFSLEDKLYHLASYGVFGFFLQRSAAVLKGRSDPLFLFLVFLVGVIYALTDELHQLFVPGRTFDGGDLAADGLGLLLGQFVWKVSRRYAPSRNLTGATRGNPSPDRPNFFLAFLGRNCSGGSRFSSWFASSVLDRAFPKRKSRTQTQKGRG